MSKFSSAIKGILFVDVDGTITNGPNIWQWIYQKIGKWESDGIPIQTRFLNGEIDYAQFAREDAAHYAGIQIEQLKCWCSEIPYRENSLEVLKSLKQSGMEIVLLSTGLTCLTSQVCQKLDLAHHFANELHERDGILTGEVKVHVSHDIPESNKGSWVRLMTESINRQSDSDYFLTAAIGDSTGDIPMFMNVDYPFLLLSQESEMKMVQECKKEVPNLILLNSWMQLPARLFEAYTKGSVIQQVPYGSTNLI